nr:hypothetical protein [Tanacetum cinerariifolium]
DGSIQLNTCSQSNKGEGWESSACSSRAPASNPDCFSGCSCCSGTSSGSREPKRGLEGIDANAPLKSLRRDHADLQPSGSSRGGKSLAAMQLCLASNIFVYESVPADVSDPDPLAFADAALPPPADVIRSSQGVAAVGDPRSENVSSPTVEAKLLRKSVAQVDRREQRIQARESEIKNLEVLLEAEADMKRAAEEKSARLIQELEKMCAQFSKLQVSNERLSHQVDTLQQQVSGEE